MLRTWKASELVRIWDAIKYQIYTPKVCQRIGDELPPILLSPIPFTEQRDEKNVEVDKLINGFTSFPCQQWEHHLLNSSPTLLVFLSDRIKWVATYLDRLGDAGVSHESQIERLVRTALVDWWHRRDKSIDP